MQTRPNMITFFEQITLFFKTVIILTQTTVSCFLTMLSTKQMKNAPCKHILKVKDYKLVSVSYNKTDILSIL